MTNQKMATSLKKVNSEIQKQIGDFTLIKGRGYFWVWSDNDANADVLGSAYTTSIPVMHLNHQSLDTWISDVKQIVSDARDEYSLDKEMSAGLLNPIRPESD